MAKQKIFIKQHAQRLDLKILTVSETAAETTYNNYIGLVSKLTIVYWFLPFTPEI